MFLKIIMDSLNTRAWLIFSSTLRQEADGLYMELKYHLHRSYFKIVPGVDVCCGFSVLVSGISEDSCDVRAGAAVEGHAVGKVWRSNKKIHLDRKGTDISCINAGKKRIVPNSLEKNDFLVPLLQSTMSDQPCIFLLNVITAKRSVSV